MATVISVRFRNGCKSYFFDPRDLLVRSGQDVIVETAQGLEFAHCAEGNHTVADEAVVAPLRRVVRIATENDRRTVEFNRTREKDAFGICQEKILARGLDMKLVRVEYSFDGNKILFFFTADGRVDFRELVKDLAGVFRSRIELRQIGVRDEAKMVGGLGICGRPFCCNSYMDDFVPVSIKMAKTQNLSLNPTKISGTCGRLMCCLKYEQDAYEDAASRMPRNESFVLTPDGPGNVSDINLLKETVTVRLDDHTDAPRCYRNCEVCVLRNGKGSRDGIVIPRERPERYKDPVEEDIPPVTVALESVAESAAEGEISRPRRRNRGAHRTRPAENPEQKTAVPERAAPRKEGDGESKKPAAEKGSSPKNPDSAKGGNGSRRSRGNRNRSGNPKPQNAAPTQNTAPTAPAAPAAGEGKPASHRPNRRRYGHRKPGGQNRSGSAE